MLTAPVCPQSYSLLPLAFGGPDLRHFVVHMYSIKNPSIIRPETVILRIFLDYFWLLRMNSNLLVGSGGAPTLLGLTMTSSSSALGSILFCVCLWRIFQFYAHFTLSFQGYPENRFIGLLIRYTGAGICIVERGSVEVVEPPDDSLLPCTQPPVSSTTQQLNLQAFSFCPLEIIGLC
jgi:hypothetical protein